jgi:7,8-dihydropterin-6-yl-methyl-4-(beta-D-ribofuranosyl)aminobenzene 5'-phosphate synthase
MPNGVLALDALEILVVVDNETDILSSVDEGVPQIPEVAHRPNAAKPQA